MVRHPRGDVPVQQQARVLQQDLPADGQQADWAHGHHGALCHYPCVALGQVRHHYPQYDGYVWI